MLQTRYVPSVAHFIEKFFADQSAETSNVVTSQWAPRVDIREEKERFVIAADVPGVDPAEIEIHMEKGILTLKGERKSTPVGEGETQNLSERAHGIFYRRFALPDSANPDAIIATGKHGVLEIAIPKRPEVTPRRITVG